MGDIEFEGAKRVIAALVRKYGAVDLTVSDLVSVDYSKLHVASNVDGFSYRYAESPNADAPPTEGVTK